SARTSAAGRRGARRLRDGAPPGARFHGAVVWRSIGASRRLIRHGFGRTPMNLPKLSLFPFMDAAEPLGKRAPAVDENGKALSDFMMIIPGLRDKPQMLIQQTLYDIHAVLACFQHAVVFAELNLR